MSQDELIVVTGACGFVGRKLLSVLLENGHNRVRALYHTAPCTEIPVEWVQADLTDPAAVEEAVRDAHTVIHLAAVLSYHPEDAVRLKRINHLATRDLVNACLEKQVRRLIYLSSASTLTRSTDPLLVGANLPGRPYFHTIYARTKYLGELEVHRGRAEGLSTLILNPTLILGAGDWSRGSNRIIQRIAEGMSFFPPGNLALTSLDRLAATICRALETELEGGPLLLYDHSLSYEELIRITCGMTGRKAPDKKLHPFLAGAFAAWEAFRSLFSGSKPLVSREAANLSCQPFRYVRPEPDPHGSAGDVSPHELIREVL